MGQIELTMLDACYFSNHHEYTDLGAVNDINNFARILYDSFERNKNTTKAIWGESQSTIKKAMYLGFQIKDKFLWFTFYEKSDPINEQFLKAHEQSHIAHATGRIDILKDIINLRKLKVFDYYSDFWKCEESRRELIANLGGIYRLEKRGINILEIPLNQVSNDAIEAFAVYQRAVFYDDLR